MQPLAEEALEDTLIQIGNEIMNDNTVSETAEHVEEKDEGTENTDIKLRVNNETNDDDKKDDKKDEAEESIEDRQNIKPC